MLYIELSETKTREIRYTVNRRSHGHRSMDSTTTTAHDALAPPAAAPTTASTIMNEAQAQALDAALEVSMSAPSTVGDDTRTSSERGATTTILRARGSPRTMGTVRLGTAGRPFPLTARRTVSATATAVVSGAQSTVLVASHYRSHPNTTVETTTTHRNGTDTADTVDPHKSLR